MQNKLQYMDLYKGYVVSLNEWIYILYIFS